jgi:site-specific recombinase
MADDAAEPLRMVQELVAALRPTSRHDKDQADARWHELLTRLESDADARRALAASLFSCFAAREQRSFYTETGLLPNTGFFSELRQKLAHKLLPEQIDVSRFQDCLHLIFPGQREIAWFCAIPADERGTFFELLAREAAGTRDECGRIQGQLLDSVIIVGHRIAAMGLEPELLRILPRLARGESPFIALCDETTLLAQRLRAGAASAERGGHAADHLQVLLEQCREAVERAHQTAASRGTSLPLTFLVVRLRQHLERLELLVGLLTGRPADAARAWCDLLWSGISEELLRNSLRRHIADLTALLALRVTENAGRTGEHYIARDRAEWRGMWRAAAGAGFLIALMALAKILGSFVDLALLNQGLLNGAIYAGGFAVIHLCRGTVATKQPAMTAATIAATVCQTRGRLRNLDRLAELIVATARSQQAAIAGNVLVAFPLAVAVAFAIFSQLGGHPIPAESAAGLLEELNPLKGTLIFAGIAGIWLFTAGLVSGYVDNQAAYSRLGERIAAHPWLVPVIGGERAARLGVYLDRNAGGLAGNLFFGMMLGLTPAIGKMTGLPLDIRHIAFSAANLGYALVSLDFRVDLLVALRSAAGVALIGATNLAVSFSLALWLALRSRGVDFIAIAALVPELWQRLRNKPARFFLPPRENHATAPEAPS